MYHQPHNQCGQTQKPGLCLPPPLPEEAQLGRGLGGGAGVRGRGTHRGLRPSLPPRPWYLVSAEVLQQQQAVAAPRGDGHSDLHQDPVDGEQAQVLDLWPRGGVSAPQQQLEGEGRTRSKGANSPWGQPSPSHAWERGPHEPPGIFNVETLRLCQVTPKAAGIPEGWAPAAEDKLGGGP